MNMEGGWRDSVILFLAVGFHSSHIFTQRKEEKERSNKPYSPFPPHRLTETRKN
jgi:hypothetical protein